MGRHPRPGSTSSVSVTYKTSASMRITFALDQEIRRLPEILDSINGLWPFIVDGRKHPIFRMQSPSSNNPGGIRYLVSSETFDIIGYQMTHRDSAGNGFTPWESQYVDVRAVEAPHGKDKVAQAGTSHPTHVRMPTGEENITDPFRKRSFSASLP